MDDANMFFREITEGRSPVSNGKVGLYVSSLSNVLLKKITPTKKVRHTQSVMAIFIFAQRCGIFCPLCLLNYEA